MMDVYLSKSDFKVAQECPTKLYYKKMGYPSLDAANAYLQLLADGGYMIEAIAKLLYPDGINLMSNLSQANTTVDAIQSTLQALVHEQVTLFEATLWSQHKLARVDILRKSGDRFDLVEVKAKSYDSANPYSWRGKKGGILAAWRPYLEDVAFQVLVLQELFPTATIHAYLLMPDRAKTTTIANIHSLFRIHHEEDPQSVRSRVTIEFTGDPDQLRQDHFLTQVDVSADVDALLPGVRDRVGYYLDSLQPELVKIESSLAVAKCKACEFHTTGLDPQTGRERNGFRECWGKLADPSPHLLDLGYVNDAIAQPLIAQGITSLLEIPVDRLVKQDGTEGIRNRRQRLQIEHTRSNTEWIDDGFREQLLTYTYPLHFIDFETSTLAVPYHAGMSPYEQVAFQWSCHTLQSPDSLPSHAEWLNLDNHFPNLQFAESLMQHLGTTGTVLMWAVHEQTILRDIQRQLQTRQYYNPELQHWLDWITTGQLVDMRALTERHYFHPLMQGKVSIKVVLEAIWKTSSTLRSRFPEYLKLHNQEILSPYQALPSLTIAGAAVSITDGRGAVQAYQAMLYGAERDDPAQQQQWAQLLRQYCQLDTLAMVMIWQHWLGVN
jgi:hypothetical protein